MQNAFPITPALYHHPPHGNNFRACLPFSAPLWSYIWTSSMTAFASRHTSWYYGGMKIAICIMTFLLMLPACSDPDLPPAREQVQTEDAQPAQQKEPIKTGEIPAAEEGQEPVKLEWVDKATGKALFTVRDIEVFDWDRQIFKLRPEADRKFAEWVKSSELPIRHYSLNDSEGTVYAGEIYVRPCNKPPEGPTIWLKDPRTEHNPLNPPFYRIREGRKDPRFSDRLKSSLKRAGVTGKIDLPDNQDE